MSSGDKIAMRYARAVQRRGTMVTLTWSQWSPGWTLDAVSKKRIGTATKQTVAVTGWVHMPDPHNPRIRHFTTIQEGDLIIDLPADKARLIEGDLVTGVRFIVDGKGYTTAKVADVMTDAWDAMVQGVRINRTFLLTGDRGIGVVQPWVRDVGSVRQILGTNGQWYAPSFLASGPTLVLAMDNGQYVNPNWQTRDGLTELIGDDGLYRAPYLTGTNTVNAEVPYANGYVNAQVANNQWYWLNKTSGLWQPVTVAAGVLVVGTGVSL